MKATVIIVSIATGAALSVGAIGQTGASSVKPAAIIQAPAPAANTPGEVPVSKFSAVSDPLTPEERKQLTVARHKAMSDPAVVEIQKTLDAVRADITKALKDEMAKADPAVQALVEKGDKPTPGAGWKDLTPEERTKLSAARQAQFTTPEVQAILIKLTPVQKQYMEALKAATIKGDPAVAAILDKEDAATKARMLARPLSSPGVPVAPVAPTPAAHPVDSGTKPPNVGQVPATQVAVPPRNLAQPEATAIPASPQPPTQTQPFAPGTSAPASQSTFSLSIQNHPVEFERWGGGSVGIVFFGDSGGRLAKKLAQDQQTCRSLMGSDWSCFIMHGYPAVPAYSGIVKALYTFGHIEQPEAGHNPEAFVPLDFSGIASSVVSGLKKRTGLRKFLLVGVGMGAGVILWDYKLLENDTSVQFILIGPPEWDTPKSDNIEGLRRTVLLTDPTPDYRVRDHRLLSWLASHRTHVSKEDAVGDAMGEIVPSALFKLIGLTLSGKFNN